MAKARDLVSRSGALVPEPAADAPTPAPASASGHEHKVPGDKPGAGPRHNQANAGGGKAPVGRRPKV